MRKSAQPKYTKHVSRKSGQSKKDSKSSSKTTTKRSGITQTATGRRIGTKKSDLRYEAADGSQWASPFEYRVYTGIMGSDDTSNVRRTTSDDALHYSTPVKKGRCSACNSCEVVQDRTYTPDLAVSLPGGLLIFLETKGYFPGPKRNLFRAARQSNPQVDVRLVASSNHWVTKGKTHLSDWAKRFKIPFHVWDGKLPEDWL